MATISSVITSVELWCGWDNPTASQNAITEIAVNRAAKYINRIRNYTSTIDNVVEDEYTEVLIQMSAFDITKRGVDGTTGFSENNVSRSYGGGGYPKEYTSQIRPIMKGY